MAKVYQLTICTILYQFAPLAALAHGVSDADKEAMLSGGLLEYALLGAKHMVTGYDHLLFIFGVIFFLTKFSEIVKFITAFTVGHSITLIFATFMGIAANAYLVDAVIALTVVYKGFDNIDGFKRYLKINAPNMLGLVFVFGLIHGFGLSTRLQDLPLNHDELLLEILSFNVGIEVGQVVALSVMLIALSGVRKTKSFAKFSFGANVVLIFAGFALLAMQLNGYFHDIAHHEEEGQYSTGHVEHEHHSDDAAETHVHGNESDNPETSNEESESHPHSHDDDHGHSHDHGHGHGHGHDH